VLDLVYRREGTALVERARELGIPGEDGSEMLLQQGVAAFERWTGSEAPIGAMREAMASEAVR
jgi:shikimate dehydrogenase